MGYLYSDLTDNIICCFYEVYNTLGYGFLEKVYEKALLKELNTIGLKSENQMKISVYYKGDNIGDYYADIVVEDKIIIELKSCETLCEAHGLQLLNYLKATNYEVGLLLNFGKKPEIARKIFTKNQNKKKCNKNHD